MNPPPPPEDLDFVLGEPSGFDSSDCVNIIIDGFGDTTVRPMRPELRALILAERERHARLREQMRAEQAQDKPAPPDASP
jgi:hypothetical protein